jgi:signal transduction histidine kinase
MRLLNRTVKQYLLYSVVLVSFCTPIFYFAIQKLFEYEMDLALLAHKRDLDESKQGLKSEEDLEVFGLMNDEFVFTQKDKILKDSLYSVSIYDSALAQTLPYRVLRTGIVVDGHPYEMLIRESMVSTKRLVAALMILQVTVLGLLVTGLVIINRKLSRQIWSPFYTILEQLKKYHIEQENKLVLPNVSTAEFREMNAAITQLVNQNREAFLSQREFTENAAHELQTPLAICRNKLELLAQTNELTQEQADLVADLLQATDRLARLNKNLLLLAKIENNQFIEVGNVSVDGLLKRYLKIFETGIEEKQLVVTQNLTTINISTNPVLLDVLVSNLITNAIRHTARGGKIDIEMRSAELIIKNSGQPFAHPEKIFNRFHRESRQEAGSGLGLSIVKKIAEVSSFKLAYCYEAGLHCFSLTLKPFHIKV